MNEFHCVLQVCPRELPAPREIDLDGIAVEGLALPRLETRFQRSFEQASADLQLLPRFYFEPDGSFVWVQEVSGHRYQLDGSLYDDGRHLLNIELKGTCDPTMLDRFLTCLGWPEEEIVFQLVQRGIFLVEDEFRKHFARTEGP